MKLARKRLEQKKIQMVINVIFGLLCLATLVLYLYVYQYGTLYFKWQGFCVSGLSVGIDRFRGLYGWLCSLIWFVALQLMPAFEKKKEHMASFYVGTILTYLATMGIFYSDNLLQVYIFFEVMSLCSYLWVAHEGDEESRSASRTYLFVSVLSGLVMLMGVIVLYCQFGSLEFGTMKAIALSNAVSQNQKRLGAFCLLFGFGAKAGAYPMHFYLHSAYPASPAPATAILSAALTKAGIFGILILGLEVCSEDKLFGMVLVILGVITMLFNGILGWMQMDVMKLLACSSVSQLGFILLGCGMIVMMGEDHALALQGTVLYMVNHSLFKLILFLSCGYLCMQAGSRNLEKLSGIGKKHKYLFLPMLTGCAGLAGIPLFSGYIAKTLLHESVVEYIHMTGSGTFQVIEWLFLLAGGCTFAYAAKIMITLFGKPLAQQNAGQRRMKLTEVIAVYIPTVISLVCGILPYQTMNHISDLKELYHMHEVHYFTPENFKGSFISILIGCILFFGLVRPFFCQKRKIQSCRFLEQRILEPFFGKILPAIGGGIAICFDSFVPVLQKPLTKLLEYLAIILDRLVPCVQKVGAGILSGLSLFWGKILLILETIVEDGLFNPSKHRDLQRMKRVDETMTQISKTSKVIQASLSFGFLMICIGLCLTLLYLLL